MVQGGLKRLQFRARPVIGTVLTKFDAKAPAMAMATATGMATATARRGPVGRVNRVGASDPPQLTGA